MKNPDRVAFNVFGKDIFWYAILMAVGIVVAAIIAFTESKRKKMHDDTVIDLCLWCVPLGIFFARLYYVLFNLDYYMQDPITMLYIWNGGLAIPGAVLGGALGVFIYSRIKKARFLRFADVIVPGLVLAQAIGRWGNFFNQEAYGLELALANPVQWWFRFPLVVRIDQYIGTEIVGYSYHMATFFYESVCCLLIFLVIWLCRKKFKHDGDALFTYIMLYCAERAVMEQFRTDALMLGNFRVTQVLCAALVVLTGIFLIIRAVKEKKAGRLLWPKPLPEVAETVPTAAFASPIPDEVPEVQKELVVDDDDLAAFGVKEDGDEDTLPSANDTVNAENNDETNGD